MKFMQYLESTSILELPLNRVAGNPRNVRCFMEFEAVEKDGKKKDIGRVEFELFSAALPKTCENFRSFCTGERGNGVGIGEVEPLHVKGRSLRRAPQELERDVGHVRRDDVGTEPRGGRRRQARARAELEDAEPRHVACC